MINALTQRLADSPAWDEVQPGPGESTANHRHGEYTAISSFYGFLPHGDLWVADPSPRAGLHEQLRNLQPQVFAALRLGNFSEAVQTAYRALDALAYELRPWWADCLEKDEALVQAILVEVEQRPIIARLDTTLGELDGTALWVNHRAWIATPDEAMSIARRLWQALGCDQGSSECPLEVSGIADNKALWTRAWL